MHRRRTATWAGLLALVALGVIAPAMADAAGDDVPLFRVILKDGTALVSAGEFTRVGDRVVFSMPVGVPRGDRTHLVNLPASAINWDTTMRYAEAVRYAQYLRTRAEADFAVLTGEVAETLNQIALTNDPTRRLQLAGQVRKTLIAWPADHFGYRSSDIREMVALVEQAISELQAAAGVQQFDVSLVATIEPPSMPTLPDPTPTQAIDQLLIAARLSDVPAERMGLLRSAIGVLDETASRLPKQWVHDMRASARAQLEAEARMDRSYGDLSRTAIDKAATAAAGADVRGVERVIDSVRSRDEKLGQRRKETVAGLLAALEDRLDSARRLRLMRDQWVRRSEAYRAYRRVVSGPIDQVARLRPTLEDIRALAGPAVASLPDVVQRLERAYRQLVLVKPPDEMSTVHATLLSAVELGQQAARTRERAAVTADLTAAWDASSAAAGSMMMLAQARKQIDTISRPPELR
ncbi:MAG TPA: hypothetical protein VGK32_16310 [Vicinamibacterales bacterium]|jgi:hypothetical protein